MAIAYNETFYFMYLVHHPSPESWAVIKYSNVTIFPQLLHTLMVFSNNTAYNYSFILEKNQVKHAFT